MGAAIQRHNSNHVIESKYDDERNAAKQALKIIQGTAEGLWAKEHRRTKPEENNPNKLMDVMMEDAECAKSVHESIEMLHKVAHLPHKFLDLYLISYKWTVVHKKTVGFTRRAFIGDVVSAANNDVMFQERAEDSGDVLSTKFHLSKHANMILSLSELDKSRKPRKVWCDWLYVARTDISKKDPISYGLFSCRRFQKGETIGPYVGTIVWEKRYTKKEREGKQPLLPAPDDEVMEAASNMKGFLLRTEEGIRIVSPLVRPETELENRLLMGFEYMAQDNKKFNVEVTSEGLVRPLKILRKGDELIVAPLRRTRD